MPAAKLASQIAERGEGSRFAEASAFRDSAVCFEPIIFSLPKQHLIGRNSQPGTRRQFACLKSCVFNVLYPSQGLMATKILSQIHSNYGAHRKKERAKEKPKRKMQFICILVFQSLFGNRSLTIQESKRCPRFLLDVLLCLALDFLTPQPPLLISISPPPEMFSPVHSLHSLKGSSRLCLPRLGSVQDQHLSESVHFHLSLRIIAWPLQGWQ